MNELLNIADLVETLEKRFKAVEGADKAYLYVDGDLNRRVIHQTFAVGVSNAKPAEEQEDELVDLMLEVIAKALDAHEAQKIPIGTTLYWRKRPEISFFPGGARLRMRFGIEGFSAIGHNPTREEAGE